MLSHLFQQWWNSLAHRNGKAKFRSQREAAEFVRRIANESRTPNQAMIEMRREYLEIKAKREDSKSARPEQDVRCSA